MLISREWAMGNRWTFEIPPIKELITRYMRRAEAALEINTLGWLDPFSGCSTLAGYRNDIDPERGQPSCMPADEWLRSLDSWFSHAGILFDPPYSGRQVKECYSALNKIVHRDDTNSYFFANIKRAAAPLIRIGGYAICCGWNTNGFGAKYGFELQEILLVAHGSSHNDTIVTVEKKVGRGNQLELLKEVARRSKLRRAS